jgi:hypothetical protein
MRGTSRAVPAKGRAKQPEEENRDPAAVFASIAPNSKDQRRIAQFFADAMQVFEAPGMSNRWALTLPGRRRGLLRLNVGRVEGMVAWRGGVTVHASGLTEAELARLQNSGAKVREGYQTALRFHAADSKWIRVPLDLLPQVMPVLLPAVREFLAKSPHRASSRHFHSMEVVEYLEARTGQRLPRPSY